MCFRIKIQRRKKLEKEFGLNSAISYELKNIIQEILPNRINTYFNLTNNLQIERKDSFIKDLNKMLEVAIKTLNILNQNDLNKDERESMLIEIKY